jgi:uncharacterized protein
LEKTLASMTTATDNLLAPVQVKARLQSLDLIRGVSILGILAVNADGFAAPMVASLQPLIWPFGNHGGTAICYWVVDAFFHEKFVTLFSMLFGVSLYLVGGERSDKSKGTILWRRLGALFLFSMLHGFGIWWGDILSLYAITGVLMVFCRSWRPRTLMIAGVILYGLMGLKPLIPALTHSRKPEAQIRATVQMAAPHNAAIRVRKAKAAADTSEASSSWAGAYRVNTREYLRLLSGDPWLIPSTLGLMMVGLSLFKSGFLAGRSSTQRYAAVIAAGTVALAILAWLAWQKDVAETPILLGDGIGFFLAPSVALAYASGLILLLRAGAGQLLSPFAATGRMAFTNYLTQSLIMTSIFYGGRGGLMGEVNRPALWAIVLGIWALQLIWSPLWLSRFEMGPFEWAWRCLTYGRRLPLSKRS